MIVSELVFSGDLDDQNNPIVQSQGLSSDLRNKIINNHSLLQSIIPSILDPINKTANFTSNEFSTTLQPSTILLTNSNDGLFLQQDNTQLLICGNPAYSFTQLKFDFFKLSNDIDQQYATYTCNSGVVNTIGGPTMSYTAGDVTIADNGSIAVVQMTADGVSMANNNTSSNTNYLVNGINYQGTSFELLSNSNDRFLKLSSGIQHRIEELNVTISNFLEPHVNYFMVSGGIDIFVYPVSQYFCELIQTSGTHDGWSC
jgi:hypothetical protein